MSAFHPKRTLAPLNLSGAMVLDAALNHALHVGIVCLHVRVAVLSALVQTLRPLLGALSFAALSSTLFVAHPQVASRSGSSCPEMVAPHHRSNIPPAFLTSAFHPF